jgi:rRNA maturation endonuclease Nob1
MSMTDDQEKILDETTPFDLLNSDNYTTREIRDGRYHTCLDCDRLFSPTRMCKECGCFMAMKTWLKEAHCPLGKW